MPNPFLWFVAFLQSGATRHQSGRWRYSLHVHIASLFAALTLLVGAGLIVFNSRQTTQLALSASKSLFGSVSQAVLGDISRTFMPAQSVVDLVSFRVGYLLTDWRESMPFMREALLRSGAASALFVGYRNGDYILLRPIPPESVLRKQFDMPLQTVYQAQALIRKSDGSRQFEMTFFDVALNELGSRYAPEFDGFDPRLRPWYQLAAKSATQIMTPLYVYFDTGEIGLTVARSTASGQAVVGADITLNQLSASFALQPLSRSTQLLLFDESRRVLADRFNRSSTLMPEGVQKISSLDDLGVPVVTQLSQLISQKSDIPSLLESEGRTWHVHVTTMAGPGGGLLYLALLSPEDELLEGVNRVRQNTAMIGALLLLLTMPLVWLVAKRAARPLDYLVQEADAIQLFRFDSPAVPRSFIREFDNLAESMNMLKTTLTKFMDIGYALAEERSFDLLIGRILSEAMKPGQATGGVVYLMEGQSSWLTPVKMQWNGEDINKENMLPAIPPELALQHPAARSIAQGTGIEQLSLEDCDRWYGALKCQGLPLISLAIPLRNRQQRTIGVLQLFFPRDEQEGSLRPELVALIEALSGSAAMAIETQRLVEQQKVLLESFIQLIARAIDTKSPYTGWHCQRVPELAKMLAEAMCEDKTGKFADFSMSDEEWDALHIASWLHDCGKITTPDHVADKATKLETVCNRIHEIRTRFEVVKCNAEITCLNAILAGGDEAELRAELKKNHAELDEEFAFIAACNQGSEYMGQDKVERIEQIARRTWLRTLSDRLGVSRDELRRKKRQPEAELPVIEPLLADRRDHLIFRGLHELPDPDLDIKIPMPRYLYNHGEIYNLSIEHGTLTAEERYKINQHIVHTISLLSKLPFPYHLRNVPEIAGGHHERMDGKGYPKCLKGDEMSPLARMMAVVDVFEALTAGDRPYKPGKKLSEALKIMQGMKTDGHLDPDVFDLFLSSGVYRRYAERFLSAEQIDS